MSAKGLDGDKYSDAAVNDAAVNDAAVKGLDDDLEQLDETIDLTYELLGFRGTVNRKALIFHSQIAEAALGGEPNAKEIPLDQKKSIPNAVSEYGLRLFCDFVNRIGTNSLPVIQQPLTHSENLFSNPMTPGNPDTDAIVIKLVVDFVGECFRDGGDKSEVYRFMNFLNYFGCKSLLTIFAAELGRYMKSFNSNVTAIGLFFGGNITQSKAIEMTTNDDSKSATDGNAGGAGVVSSSASAGGNDGAITN